MMTRKVSKKLINLIKMNALSRDANGEFTIIKSSTNKKRMMHDSSGIRAGSLPNSKVWIPSKLYLNENDLEEIWQEQEELCYWFKIPLDLELIFNNHPEYFPKHPLAPSVDRKDDKLDYTRDNVVICCRLANFGRNIYPFDKFHDVIGKVTSKNTNYYEPI